MGGRLNKLVAFFFFDLSPFVERLKKKTRTYNRPNWIICCLVILSEIPDPNDFLIRILLINKCSCFLSSRIPCSRAASTGGVVEMISSSDFTAFDRDAYKKHALMERRKAAAGASDENLKPTPLQLYGNLTLHKAAPRNYSLVGISSDNKNDNDADNGGILERSPASSKVKRMRRRDDTASSSILLWKARKSSPITEEAAKQWLGERGFDSDILAKRNVHGTFPVHEAVAESDVRMLEFLRRRGAASGEALKAQDDAGMTPLHRAAMNGDEATTRWLVSHRAQSIYKFDPFFGSKARE
jgi:hypothetical protein